MCKTYKIVANEKLFMDWLKVLAMPHSKVSFNSAAIVQNDVELTSEQLNEWYKIVGDEIAETEKFFAEVINELYRLKQ